MGPSSPRSSVSHSNYAYTDQMGDTSLSRWTINVSCRTGFISHLPALKSPDWETSVILEGTALVRVWIQFHNLTYSLYRAVTSRTCLGLYSDPNLFRNLLAPQDTLHPMRSRTLLGPEHFPDILVHTHAKSPLFLFTIWHTLVYIHSPLSHYHWLSMIPFAHSIRYFHLESNPQHSPWWSYLSINRYWYLSSLWTSPPSPS